MNPKNSTNIGISRKINITAYNINSLNLLLPWQICSSPFSYINLHKVRFSLLHFTRASTGDIY